WGLSPWSATVCTRCRPDVYTVSLAVLSLGGDDAADDVGGDGGGGGVDRWGAAWRFADSRGASWRAGGRVGGVAAGLLLWCAGQCGLAAEDGEDGPHLLAVELRVEHGVAVYLHRRGGDL